MLKRIWSFLKEIFGGAELNNKNNITQINNKNEENNEKR